MFIPIDYQLTITNILYITLYIYFFYCLYVNITLKYLKNIFKKMCNLIQYRMIETSVDFYSSSTPPHPQLLQFWFLSDIDLLILPLSCIWVLSQNTKIQLQKFLKQSTFLDCGAANNFTFVPVQLYHIMASWKCWLLVCRKSTKITIHILNEIAPKYEVLRFQTTL